MAKNHPVIDLGLDKDNKKGCGCSFFPFIVIAGVVAYLASSGNLDYYLNTINFSVNKFEASSEPSWRSACGSPFLSGTVWYSVIGEGSAINLVKNNYCGDAFVTPHGNIQAASFSSQAEAEEFANKLSKLTGYKFWVAKN